MRLELKYARLRARYITMVCCHLYGLFRTWQLSLGSYFADRRGPAQEADVGIQPKLPSQNSDDIIASF